MHGTSTIRHPEVCHISKFCHPPRLCLFPLILEMCFSFLQCLFNHAGRHLFPLILEMCFLSLQCLLHPPGLCSFPTVFETCFLFFCCLLQPPALCLCPFLFQMKFLFLQFSPGAPSGMLPSSAVLFECSQGKLSLFLLRPP